MQGEKEQREDRYTDESRVGPTVLCSYYVMSTDLARLAHSGCFPTPGIYSSVEKMLGTLLQ